MVPERSYGSLIIQPDAQEKRGPISVCTDRISIKLVPIDSARRAEHRHVKTSGDQFWDEDSTVEEVRSSQLLTLKLSNEPLTEWFSLLLLRWKIVACSARFQDLSVVSQPSNRRALNLASKRIMLMNQHRYQIKIDAMKNAMTFGGSCIRYVFRTTASQNNTM